MNGGAFNLTDEPWILLADPNGNDTEVSLTDALVRAHEYKSFSGELPTQDAAVLRLLLAVLYAVFTRVDEKGESRYTNDYAPDIWRRLWNLKRFPEKVIREYLTHYRDRFWLVHPEQPFWQVSFDKKNPPVNAKGVKCGPTELPIVKMIGDIASYENLFCGRSDNWSISYPEAARWLVHLNSFDVSPVGASGDKIKRIKGYEKPWPSDIGLMWVGGKNLFETLMLNLVLEHNQENWPESMAWWEADPPCRTVEDLERTDVPAPSGIVELMSMQYRYVLLQTDNDSVTGYELWSGVKFENANLFIEKMTPWKTAKNGDRYPLRYEPSKQLWRDFAAFMPNDGDAQPGVMKWIYKLQNQENNNDKKINFPFFQIHSVGVTYKQNTAVADIFSDSISINAGMLSELGKNWVGRISGVLSKSEKMAYALGELAEWIEMAAGGVKAGKKAKIIAKENAYFYFDIPFRTWLAGIDPIKDDINKKCDAWTNTAREIILKLGRELIAQAGPQAFVGREINKTLFTAAGSYLEFKNVISKIVHGNIK